MSQPASTHRRSSRASAPRATRAALALALGAATLVGASACSVDDVADPAVAPLVVPRGLELDWIRVPHRLALAQLVAEPPRGDNPWRARVFNQGGSFGSFDRTVAKIAYTTVSSSRVAAVHGERQIEVPAGQKRVSFTIEIDAPGEGALAAVLRGVRISSDEYSGNAPWDEKTYNPALGYTSAGIGVRLGPVSRAGHRASFEISASARPAACDRADAAAGDDMNGTVGKASTWITIYYTVLAVRLGAVTHARADYFLNYPDFRKNGIKMDDAPDDKRKVRVKGVTGKQRAFVGLTGFDFISNDPSNKDPACAIKAVPECVGPGRYIRTLRAIASLDSYDAATGQATIDINTLFTNSAADGAKDFEAGNMCVRARGDAVLIQLDGGDSSAEKTFISSRVPNATDFVKDLEVCEAGLRAVGCK